MKIDSLDLVGIEQLATQMANQLPPPLTIGLSGTLGAGKTTLVQALARAAGIDSVDVTSPTFTLLQSHRGRSLTIHHLDAYRVADEDEFLQLGVEELFEDEGAWTVVEWADRVQDVMPADTLWINLEINEDPSTRSLHFKTSDKEVAEVIAKLAGER